MIEALVVQAAPSARELLSFAEADFRRQCAAYEIGRQRGGIIIGTTVTVLLAFDSYFACVWSGDSRIYMVRQGGIRRSPAITPRCKIFSRVESSRLKRPDMARQQRNYARYWVSDSPELEMTTGALDAGDVFVMCSDGLTRHVEDDEIGAMRESENAQQACDRLILLTLERGAVDNVTVIVVRCDPAARASGADASVAESP